jgi:hypothetical protein
MWIPARPIQVSLLVPVLLACACTGNSPTPPLVAVAGWSWSPALAGDRPLPVIWWGSSTPKLLPLLPGGDCAASGSVQAMVIVNGAPTLAGISAACNAGTATMLPVAWTGDAVQALPLPTGSTQGTALAVAAKDGNVFVGGAVGGSSPFPMVWKNGQVALVDRSTVLPAGHDSGIVTALVASQNFVVAAGVIHRTSSFPPAFSAVVWILDPDFTSVIAHLIPSPSGVTGASFGPSVAIVLQGTTTVWSTTALSVGAGIDKPVAWEDDVASALSGLDFATGPYGVPTGLLVLGTTPYVSGFTRPSGSGGLPAPSIWADTIQQTLSTADPAVGLGAAEAIAILYEHAYVAGETYSADLTDQARLLSVPAWWDNGSRHDLGGLVAAGGGPVLSQPLFGWWRVPGTPSTATPDWPYPGGFAEIDAGPRSVAAAGSGVARVIGTVP